MLRRLLTTILALAALLSSGSSGSAQEKLRLAWAGASPTNSPVWVMQEKKLLQKQGFDHRSISFSLPFEDRLKPPGIRSAEKRICWFLPRRWYGRKTRLSPVCPAYRLREPRSGVLVFNGPASINGLSFIL